MNRGAHVPMRTCLGCGKRAPQADLLRIGRGNAQRLHIAARGAIGRGGYLHHDQTCWQAFAARKGPLRSLRCTVDKSERAALVNEIKQVYSGVGLG